MKIAILYYDGFVEFEIALACLMFGKEDLFSIALDKRDYYSEGKQHFIVDKVITDIDASEIDLLIIPGGDPNLLADKTELKLFISALLKNGKKVAGICGGAVLLAQYGFLKGLRCTGNSSGIDVNQEEYTYFKDALLQEEPVVVDGQIITSTAQGFIEFAMILSKEMGILKTDEEVKGNIKWFKGV